MSIARVRTVITGVAGSPFYANHYFLGTGALAAPAVSAFWNAVRAYLAPGGVITIEPTIQSFDEASGALVDEATWAGAAHATAGSGEPAPAQVQLLLRFRTNTIVGNRKVQGRTFVPAMIETSNTSGQGPTTTISDAFTNAWNTNVRATSVADTNPQVIWSRPVEAHTEYDPRTGAARAVPGRAGVAALVTSVNVWSRWAAQRNRRF